MDQQEARQLLEKFRIGEISEDELALLESWYIDWNTDDDLDLSEDEIAGQLYLLRDGIPYLNKKPKVLTLWPRIAAAASVVLVLSFGTYFLMHHQPQNIQPIVKTRSNDVSPGTNSATLTLANGKNIILTKSLNGTLAQQGNTFIKVKAGSELTYTSQNGGNTAAIAYNTLSTKRGEQSPFPLILADGTKVWLNAASSITFPTAFNGKDRLVKITGEAFFEVVHLAAQPFKVQAGNQIIEDIGTHFNVNTYDDEPEMHTTLLEGSVKISHHGKSVVLKPGQQAGILQAGDQIRVTRANIRQAVAWKEGLFRFDHTDLKTVMRQISRWYNLDVIYKDKVSNDDFGGQISRDVNLSQMLKILASNDVHFMISTENGKNILIITP